MAKLFTTRTHGALDYLTAGTLFMLPRALGWSDKVTRLLTGAAVNTLAYSLLTSYELGAFKLLSMKTHLTLDAISGALFLGAPLLLPDEDSNVQMALVGLGLFELMAALTTETEPSLGEQADQFGETLLNATSDLSERALGR